MASIQKSSKINMYKFVNTDDQGASADPVAKSINVQTQALNNMGRTINGIAQTVVTLKNIALHRLKQEEKEAREKFKPKYTKQRQNPFKSLMLSVKAYKVKGFLESMLSFLGSLLKIFIVRPILNWLSNPENKKKLVKILEGTWKVLKGITDFLGSQFVHAINELHDVLSGETSVWKKITSFTKLWIKFALGFMAIKFLRNPVKLLRSVAHVGKMLAIKTKLAKAQLTKRKRFLTGGKWGKGAWLLGGAVGAYSLWQFAQWALGKKENEESGDDSTPNSGGGGDRAKDREFSLKEFGEDLTTAMYDSDLAKALGIERKEEKKKNMWNPKNWFGGKKDKDSKKDGESPNALGVLAGMYTANEQFKHLIKTFKGESKEFGQQMNDSDAVGKADLMLRLAAKLESALGSKNQMFEKLQMQTQNLVESASGVANGDKTSLGEFLKWAGHGDIQSREEGGPIGSFEKGGQWLNGPDSGYPALHNGQGLWAHGLEGLFTKPGSKDGFIVPFDNAATRKDPLLTMVRLAQAKKLGFKNGPPGFEGGGLGLSDLKNNKTYRISQDKGWFEKSKVKSGGGGNWFTNMFKGWGGDKGSGGNWGLGANFGQQYQEPGSGGLGLVQRLIASHRGDELTSALLARTIFNRKAAIDKTGNPQMFKAKSGSFHDILHAPGQYPNVENGKIKGTFSNSELNAAGKAMKLAKEAHKLKERLGDSGLDPAKTQQLLTATIFKPGSGLNKGGLMGLLTGGGGVRFGKYTFQNKPTNAMNALMGGMNPLMMKGMMTMITNLVGGKKDGGFGRDLIMTLASGIIGGGMGKEGGKGGGMMDALFGMFGMPTQRGGQKKKPGGSMSGGLGQVLQSVFGGKGGKDKKEERMEFKKRENERHRQIMKYEASQQKRNIMSRLHDQASQNAREITSSVNASNKSAASQARMGAEAVARLSQQASQNKGNAFISVFKSIASQLSSSKSK
tara:strand:+ start:7559 stop:10441 length:2883 start_codon:yes stop_codon:yes gene_type:complete